MMRLGLVGYPLGHSLSPKIHGAALKACDLEGDYSLFPIAPEEKAALAELLSRVRSGEITGLNVTIPHKQNVIQFIDELTPTARSIGAVNTIYMRDDKLIGDNTDAVGFFRDLNRFLNMERDGLSARLGMPSQIQERTSVFQNALILGAGGSARAVVHALSDAGWDLTLYARRIEQAQELARSFDGESLLIASDLLNLELSNISLIVNTTPVGMDPNSDRSPWPVGLAFPNGVIYDLVYNPRETRLVKDAHARGLKATTGLGMLIEQAALAFELWTGCNPPRDVLFKSVDG
jgi:shikimate dehydrogenase